MPASRPPLIVSALVLLLVGGVAWLWLGEPVSEDPPTLPTVARPAVPAAPNDDDDFVGSAVCSNCHAEIARRYEANPMFHAAAVNSAATTTFSTPGEPNRFQIESYRYNVDVDGDQVVHREELLDAKGKVICQQSAVAGYSMGSGIRGKSYLIDRGGLIYQSPISWYTQDKVWDLSPGYSVHIPVTRFYRRVTDECLSCHLGRVAMADRNAPDRLKTPPFLELGVGCERCHGPGRKHVELFETGNVSPETDRQIVNPDKLDPWRRDSICFQCHLTAKRILRYGRRHFDFRPGQGLEEIWTMLIHPDDTVEGRPEKAVSHVQEMYSSKCFRESAGKFTCTSCHDSHGVPTAAERVDFYQKRCLECHTDRGCTVAEAERLAPPASGSCLHCHMPRRRTGDIPHLSQTDHRVRKRPTAPPEIHKDTSPMVFFPFMEAPLEPWENLRAKGLAAVEEADPTTSEGATQLREATETLKRVHEMQPGDVKTVQALGAIHFLAGQDAEARRWLEKGLPYEPNDEETLRMLGIACYRTGDFKAGMDYLKKSIDLNPWDPEVYARYAVMAAVFNDFPTAISAARQGLEIAPTLVPLRTDLVKFLEEAGRAREAAAERQKLLQIESLTQ